ncbi:Non-ribosomal peptide synthetase component F [Pseudomonas syringae pv. actinidiae]|uniref:Non-ribosomal peptide synthetase component F n=1 Tax=Pseudomonas syringae pv. actinidiae TaxID=103796 RepID=A0AAN4TQ03_PSESF|nr:Non-ribosomal peptide synthetase component F [Pseudomonas syringae pv. actinidiae]
MTNWFCSGDLLIRSIASTVLPRSDPLLEFVSVQEKLFPARTLKNNLANRRPYSTHPQNLISFKNHAVDCKLSVHTESSSS